MNIKYSVAGIISILNIIINIGVPYARMENVCRSFIIRKNGNIECIAKNSWEKFTFFLRIFAAMNVTTDITEASIPSAAKIGSIELSESK